LRSGKVERNIKEIKVADIPVIDVSDALDAIAAE
jgi:hypothetical protein